MNLFHLFSTELTSSPPLACLPEKVNQILQQLQQCFLYKHHYCYTDVCIIMEAVYASSVSVSVVEQTYSYLYK